MKQTGYISQLIEENPGINLTIKGQDLQEFKRGLINEITNTVLHGKKDKPISATEVEERFGICAATRWRWDKTGILKGQRVGNRIYYLESDIEELLSKKKEGVGHE